MERKIRFIKIFGYGLIILFVGCLYTIFVSSSIDKYPVFWNYFGITISLWYLITGVGILARTKWGYYLLKGFLYLLFLAFPIGTIISYSSLRYIKKENIRDLFF